MCHSLPPLPQFNPSSGLHLEDCPVKGQPPSLKEFPTNLYSVRAFLMVNPDSDSPASDKQLTFLMKIPNAAVSDLAELEADEPYCFEKVEFVYNEEEPTLVAVTFPLEQRLQQTMVLRYILD